MERVGQFKEKKRFKKKVRETFEKEWQHMENGNLDEMNDEIK